MGVRLFAARRNLFAMRIAKAAEADVPNVLLRVAAIKIMFHFL